MILRIQNKHKTISYTLLLNLLSDEKAISQNGQYFYFKNSHWFVLIECEQIQQIFIGRVPWKNNHCTKMESFYLTCLF